MGWLWSSTPAGSNASPEEPAKKTEERTFALTDEQRQRIFGKPGNISSGNAAIKAESDKQIEAFIKSFDAPSKASATPDTATTDTELTHPKPPPPSRLNQDGSLPINPEHLYPRTMSCRQAFDQAFYCQSLGGKFNDIYRYGHLQSCSEQWNAFWFCMRHRTLPSENKEEIIASWHEDREKRKKKEFGSSEDVWGLREVAVERAFWRDPDKEGERE